MNDSIKEGLEGLSKMDGVSNFLYALMYWVGVIFVLLFVTYILFRFMCVHRIRNVELIRKIKTTIWMIKKRVAI